MHPWIKCFVVFFNKKYIVLLSALVERFGVSRMRDFLKTKYGVVLAIMDMVSAKYDVNGLKEKKLF